MHWRFYYMTYGIFSAPITPIITNVNHTVAMGKLRDLWVTQQQHFEKVKNATRELCDKTKQDIVPIAYLFEEIDPLLERQVKVLTKPPWRNDGELRRQILAKYRVVRGKYYYTS